GRVPEASDDDLQPQLAALEPRVPVRLSQVLVADQGEPAQQVTGRCAGFDRYLVGRLRPVSLVHLWRGVVDLAVVGRRPAFGYRRQALGLLASELRVV